MPPVMSSAASSMPPLMGGMLDQASGGNMTMPMATPAAAAASTASVPSTAVAAWVPTERIGDVLGLRGSIIQRIRQLSGASQVHVHEEDGRQPVTPVEVAGSLEAVSKVGELVQAVLDGKHEAIGYVRRTMDVPERMLRNSGGRGGPGGHPLGQALKRVSAASGAWVQQPDPNGPLVIVGTSEAVAQAQQLLHLDEAEDVADAPRREQLLQQLRSHLESAGGKPGIPQQMPLQGISAQAATAFSAAAAQAAAQVAAAQSSTAVPCSGACGMNPAGSPCGDPGGGQLLAGFSSGPMPGGMAQAAPGLGNLLAGRSPAPNVVPAPAGTAAGHVVTAHFEIPAQRVKDVLGVKGRNVKALKAQSGIQKINIMDRSDPATVTVTGTPASIEACRFMVLSIAAGDQSVIGNVVEHMEIDQRIVSKFIGPKGQVISQIKDQSGAYLEVRETGGGQPPRIIMTGPPDAVIRARELITQFLTENGVAASMLSVGGGRGADPYAQYYAQAKLQEAQIHAQLQEAQLHAQLQEVQLQQVQHAQLLQQGQGQAFGPELQALYAHLAQGHQAPGHSASPAGAGGVAARQAEAQSLLYGALEAIEAQRHING